MEETLRIGSVVAFACHNPKTNVYSWHCGRVQKMLRKSAGKRGNYVAFTEPMLYLDAVASKVKVVCIWYRRDARARGYTFTYDGEDDTSEYSLETALALAPLEIPRRHLYDLLDPTQGPRLDAALELTKPTEKPGSKRTKGEEGRQQLRQGCNASSIDPKTWACERRAARRERPRPRVCGREHVMLNIRKYVSKTCVNWSKIARGLAAPTPCPRIGTPLPEARDTRAGRHVRGPSSGFPNKERTNRVSVKTRLFADGNI